MPQSRTIYRISEVKLEEINRILSQISNRLDALQGIRGESHFYGDVTIDGDIIVTATDDPDTAIHKMR